MSDPQYVLITDGDGAYTAGHDYLMEFVNPVEELTVANFLV